MNSVFVITLSDVFTFGVLGIIFLVGMITIAKTAIKQKLCKHEDFFENHITCDAICRRCGKNLGFIQPWRDKKAAKLKENQS